MELFDSSYLKGKPSILLIFLLLPILVFTQVITKPIGCYAGTNGTNTAVLSHPEVSGVLLIEKWADIEPSPGVFDFSSLNNKISTVKAAGLKYSLAIAGGAFGSPDWLIDSLNVNYHDFQYQNQNWKLPLWWDSICEQRLNNLITELGSQYSNDSLLSHVYVSQMTVNGIEGHLNGVDMAAFANDGFTSQKWISSAKATTYAFTDAFPDKPIVFEVHEIDNDTTVPAIIINDLSSDSSLCNRVGLGMWWISGKITYQADMIDFIANYRGDKYAQVIGRSDQLNRFKDSIYSTVFTQAKQLGIRYIEPWPYEFQHHTHDSLMHDFNNWALANFSMTENCSFISLPEEPKSPKTEVHFFPNPTNGVLNINLDYDYQNLRVLIFNMHGQLLLSSSSLSAINLSHFANGSYGLSLQIDDLVITKKIVVLH